MEETATVKFLDSYLRSIGMSNFRITASQDEIGYLVVVEVPKDSPKIGILKGKNGKNITILKHLLRVVGLNERKNPFLVIKLV